MLLRSLAGIGLLSLGGADMLASGMVAANSNGSNLTMAVALLSGMFGLVTMLLGALITSYLKHLASHPKGSIITTEVCSANMTGMHSEIANVKEILTDVKDLVTNLVYNKRSRKGKKD